MVAAQDERAGSTPSAVASSSTKVRNAGGVHAGIAAELVDLIAGRLDQDRRIVLAIGGEDRAQCLGCAVQ